MSDPFVQPVAKRQLWRLTRIRAGSLLQLVEGSGRGCTATLLSSMLREDSKAEIPRQYLQQPRSTARISAVILAGRCRWIGLDISGRGRFYVCQVIDGVS
jgi:hypothetical protein